MKHLAILLALVTPAEARDYYLPGTTFAYVSPPPSFRRYVLELKRYPRCNDSIFIHKCRRWGS